MLSDPDSFSTTFHINPEHFAWALDPFGLCSLCICLVFSPLFQEEAAQPWIGRQG
jgi:hypothetical protein